LLVFTQLKLEGRGSKVEGRERENDDKLEVPRFGGGRVPLDTLDTLDIQDDKALTVQKRMCMKEKNESVLPCLDY
jgi:hypothetical protein